MTSELSYDVILKVVLVGDTSVGKTNIMTKYISNEFNSNSKATVGVELGTKNFIIDGKSIKAQIWDTAGQERYRSITSAYYKGAKGAFIVYDITRKNSFDSIDKWVNDLTAAADKKITILVIGNKCDLEDQRQVTKEQGEQKAASLQVAFLETSALSGENLGKAFEMMMNEVYKKCHEDMKIEGENQAIQGGQDINLSKGQGKKPKKCC